MVLDLVWTNSPMMDQYSVKKFITQTNFGGIKISVTGQYQWEICTENWVIWVCWKVSSKNITQTSEDLNLQDHISNCEQYEALVCNVTHLVWNKILSTYESIKYREENIVYTTMILCGNEYDDYTVYLALY